MGGFKKGNKGGSLITYRCVYCKRRFTDKTKLVLHEAGCDARYVVRREWANEIERAKMKERKRGREEG